MKNKLLALSTGLALLGMTGMAHSTLITSASANYSVSGTTDSDTGTASAEVTYSRAPTTGISGSNGSSQASFGTGGLAASSSYSNGLGMHSGYISPEAGAALDKPLAETISFTSTATWDETFIASEAGTYEWTTVIPDAEIHLWYDTFNDYLLPEATNITAGFEGIVTANGVELFSFGSESYIDAGGAFGVRNWGIGGPPQSGGSSGYHFQKRYRYWNTGPYNFTQTIGDFAEDDLININLSASTYIYGTGAQNGARVFLGNDGIENGPGVTGYLTPTAIPVSSPVAAPVPEPATMFLFGTGLAGLVGTRHRRKKK